MTVNDWLKNAQHNLKGVGVPTPRLDCLVLLEDTTGKDRSWLLAHPEFELDNSNINNLERKLSQRMRHVPIAYILGKVEFYGREFSVNAHTLVPRPETEAMIDMLKYVGRLESNLTSWEDGGRRHGKRGYRKQKTEPLGTLIRTKEGFKVKWEKPSKERGRVQSTKLTEGRLSPNDRGFHLIDIGTGSGAIAITAKLEFPESLVTATDIDEKCIITALENAEKLGAKVEFLKGNLLDPVAKEGSGLTMALLCNLPYVPDAFQINTAATHEPRHALFGGADGLDLYREMFTQIARKASKPTYVLCESMPPQHNRLTGIAKAAGYNLRKTDSFIQLFEIGPSS